MDHIQKKVGLIRSMKLARIKEIFHKKASNFLKMKITSNIKLTEKNIMIKKVYFKSKSLIKVRVKVKLNINLIEIAHIYHPQDK
jgi:hypothetical protein